MRPIPDGSVSATDVVPPCPAAMMQAGARKNILVKKAWRNDLNIIVR
jgi:hypothetical protein